ncbi:alpha/beta-hydrolase [Fistulina hepatica ATCC 64428]|uniref:Alpha/beta-hydrolase n=1 Tax=Fistulina hepatica ATCC 64428 TaxID=1128425 RepID=A0A0D7ANZ3_9AGAR|nr:alpha/beta-hydrolase [Fistulina hepatica ATCC 64428]
MERTDKLERTVYPTSEVSDAEVSAYTPYTYYASAAYCTPSETFAWDCGTNCKANSDFDPIASGGDGTDIQYWYVGYDPDLDTVIVAHQGTDSILALLTDAEILLEELSQSLFPGISTSVKVHTGFKNDQAKTAATILSYVESGMSTYGTSTVTVVGHSLGGALALLDGVYLDMQLSDVDVRVITYGQPRVGNQEFADYVDEHVNRTHINNKEDYIPILPGLSLGYRHASGEIHIQDSGEWIACDGQDNTSELCTTGDVTSILTGDESDHDGPYNGVEMGCS